MLLRISFFQQHKRKWRYIFAAPSDTITVVHRALQESPKARDDLLVKGGALQYAKRVLDRSTTGGHQGSHQYRQNSSPLPSGHAVSAMEFGFDPLLSRSEPRSCFFMPVSAPRSTMPITLLHAAPTRPAPMSAMIGMITASARRRWTYRRRNGTKRKFFNDFSRARARKAGRVRSLRVDKAIDGLLSDLDRRIESLRAGPGLPQPLNGSSELLQNNDQVLGLPEWLPHSKPAKEESAEDRAAA